MSKNEIGFFQYIVWGFIQSEWVKPFTYADQQANAYANRLDTDETARNEPSHQDLHCLSFFFSLD